MVKSALSLAAAYKRAEVNAMEQIAFHGVPVSMEVIADQKERLAFWRGAVVSLLITAQAEATEEEQRELSAAVLLVNSSRF